MRSPLSPGVLNYLLVVAEAGSIRKAADRLFVSPSSVNRQILILEERIGTPLFDRESRGMKPTKSGEIILAAAREFNRSIQHALDQVSALRGLGSGRVSFGSLTSFAESIGAPLVASLRKDYPDLGVSYFSGNSADIIHKVLEGNLDFGLCWDAPPSTPIERLACLKVPIGIAMRPGHPLAKSPRVRLKDCLDYSVVFPSRGLEFRNVLDRINLGIGNVIAPTVEANSITLLRRLCLVGQEPVMMTANAIVDEIESGELVFAPLSDPGCGELVLSLFRRDGSLSTPATEALLKLLLGEVALLEKRWTQAFKTLVPNEHRKRRAR